MFRQARLYSAEALQEAGLQSEGFVGTLKCHKILLNQFCINKAVNYVRQILTGPTTSEPRCARNLPGCFEVGRASFGGCRCMKRRKISDSASCFRIFLQTALAFLQHHVVSDHHDKLSATEDGLLEIPWQR